jgi:hypothetical protein
MPSEEAYITLYAWNIDSCMKHKSSWGNCATSDCIIFSLCAHWHSGPATLDTNALLIDCLQFQIGTRLLKESPLLFISIQYYILLHTIVQLSLHSRLRLTQFTIHISSQSPYFYNEICAQWSMDRALIKILAGISVLYLTYTWFEFRGSHPSRNKWYTTQSPNVLYASYLAQCREYHRELLSNGSQSKVGNH